MSDVAIQVEDLGKSFLIGHQKEGDLRSSFGKKLESLIRGGNLIRESFWALKDISFNITKGDAVGIIGRNGAGKSTLLKILSRITEPTCGRFEINGRVSSLLEVGTGFHPELSGRENIYLNGTILGMKRAEIKLKFDSIVEFSGVEKFLDTPVKHYSSGMKVRLAFSVAAYLEPEILIVDEVLAVGDAEFQKKCLGKMDEVSKNEGRTVLFVSHNLAAVGALCNRGILLSGGMLEYDDEIDKVIDLYVLKNKEQNQKSDLSDRSDRKGNGQFKVVGIKIFNEKLEALEVGRSGNPLLFEIKFDSIVNSKTGVFRIDFAIDNEKNWRVGWFSSYVTQHEIKGLFDKIYLAIPKFPFGAGTYSLTYYITVNDQVIDYIHQAFYFEVEEGDFFGTGKTIPSRQTFFYIDHKIFS